ncbi:RHS repeat domain-containing protein [Flavobacterium humi]|nr:RHS repeat domain-containing protein [Flavobacterium humi]
MKKYTIALLACLTAWMGRAQETATVEMQNFAPKSPEAAAFLKYGEYPVDLSTGVPNISIPIYTVQAGNYALPISLNYHASGIRVSDEATWVGLGWNLDAGAQIVLDVRDAPDEYNQSYDNVPNADAINTYISNHPEGYNDSYFQTLKSESWVRDVYNFSSPTASGKFVIDNKANETITVYPPDAFKVEFLHIVGKTGFKITDALGNVYTFSDTKERSRTLQQYQPPYYTSAWYVDKIETPNHDVIDFTYIDGGEVNQNSYSESITHTINTNPAYACMEGEIPHRETISSLQNDSSILNTQTKKLSKIIFKEGQVIFNSSGGRLDFCPSNDAVCLSNGPRKLDNVEVQAKKNATEFTTTKKMQFQYSYFTSDNPLDATTQRKRMRLDKILNMLDVDGGDQTEFTYSDVNLPSKDSKATDYWGYYNGVANGTRIPHQVLVYSPVGIGTSYESIGNAERGVNAVKMQAGILKEIKYPTKGTTKFEYEPNTYYGVDQFSKFVPKYVDGPVVQGSGSGTQAPNELENYEDGYTTICNQSPTIGCIQYMVLQFDAVNAEGDLTFQQKNPVGSDPTLVKHQYSRVRLINENTGAVLHDTAKYNGGTITVTKHLTGMNGHFVLIVEAYGNYMSVEGTHITYYNHDTEPKNLEGMGLRIKSITNTDHTAAVTSKKTYGYTQAANLGRSSGVLINDTFATYRSIDVTNYSAACCNIVNPGGGDMHGCNWREVVTSSYRSSSITGVEGNSIVYSEVKEQNVSPDNSTNGFTISKFTIDPDYFHDSKGLIKVETANKRGKLLTKETYKTIDATNVAIVNKQINEYTEDLRRDSRIKGFKLFQNACITGSVQGVVPTMPIPLDAIFEPASYNIPSNWFYQKSTENIDYFYNAANTPTGSISSKTNYFYDNPAHLQLTRTETTNSEGETLKTVNSYPDDLLAVSQMTALKAQNRVAEVIKTEQLNSGISMATQNKTYKDWGNGIIAPEIIQTSVESNPLENRVRYTVMDTANGKPLELKMENGTPVTYIWGYNKSQPIAKIENATFASIPTATITNLQGLSDTGSEANLITAQIALRASLPNAMVSTYTYIPLVGVSTITGPNSDKITYTYDAQGRLVQVKDKDGNIVKANEYHYKN